MPPLSVWALRLACLHLVLGLTLGSVLLANKGVVFLPAAAAWRPAHEQTLLFGWTVQLVFAVGYWVLPKFAGGRSRGNDALAMLAVGLVNLGVLCGVILPLAGLSQTPAYALEAGAAAAFALHAWPRVKPARSQRRDAQRQ